MTAPHRARAAPHGARATVPLALAALLAAFPATGQDRPSEEDLFGQPAPQQQQQQQQPPPSAPAPGAPEAPGQGGAPSRDEAILGGPGAPPASGAAQAGPSAPRPNENPLAIGGVAYLRATVNASKGTPPSEWALTSPNLLDLYADVRPNDRVRAYALGRLVYQATGAGGGFQAPRLGDPSGGGTTPFGSVGAGTGTSAQLDQLWLNFDLRRIAFVTAGKQHVKWGVGRFWNPTDYLHPVKRDPLAVYDTRTGVPMVKVHLPWEARGWNLYGIGLLDDAAGQGGVSSVGRAGAGARAELVVGAAELGLDALVQRGNRPRFGVDLSAGVGEVDLYAEAALRSGADVARFVRNPAAAASEPSFDRYRPERATGFTPQMTLGGTWSWKYSDEDSANLGAEYFFNDAGYDDPRVYGALLVAQVSQSFAQYYADPRDPSRPLPAGTYFKPFYLGRHYAGLFASLPKPGSWNDCDFTLSVLGNVSDKSFIARLDAGVVVNTYLRIEAFAAGHVGNEGGEFRLAVPATALPAPLGSTYPYPVVIPRVHAPIVDAGIALRVNL